jgi:CubicO group peptidase (beta-lactamase class C family)
MSINRDLLESVDDIVDQYIKRDFFPGVICEIVKRDEVIFNKAYGDAVTFPEKEKLETNTVFDIASLTKIVTTTIVLRLVSTGQLQLNSTVDQYLSKLDGGSALSSILSKITIEQLLTHSSGLIDWYPFYSEEHDFYRVLEKAIRSSDSIKGVKYSDLNFMLLGEIIKTITGLTLGGAVKKYVSEPLEMESMIFNPVNISHIAATEYGNQTEEKMCHDRGISFHKWRDKAVAIKGKVNDGNTYYFFKGESGHAGLFSTANDLIKLGQLYMNEGVWNNSRLIDRALTQKAVKEQQPSRGLGWEISPVFPKGYGHTGFTGTSMWLVPEKELVVVTLTNRLHVHEPQNINTFRRELHESILKRT